MAAPNTVRTMPVARLRTFAEALLANLAAILAQSSVLSMQNKKLVQSGAPPMAKWLAAPVNAVKVMMNTLVPTAVFN